MIGREVPSGSSTLTRLPLSVVAALQLRSSSGLFLGFKCSYVKGCVHCRVSVEKNMLENVVIIT